MREPMSRKVWPSLLVLGALTSSALGQGSYNQLLLRVKRVFADNEIAALNEPYIGIMTSAGMESDLFPVRSTGVTTGPIRYAAEKLSGNAYVDADA